MPDLYNFREATWSFRDLGGIKVPKSVREGAYKLSVDIIVQTISHEKYTSGYTYPIKSHYGFATLVFQDCASIEIPIHQARQRIYEGRVPEAFVGWEALNQWSKADCRWYKELYLAINHGSVEEYPLIAPDDIQWNELPLMEVYVKPIEHTQYELRFLWTEPKFFTDCTGILRNGKSKMPDSAHENGLPADGTQPQKTDPSAPFNDSLPFTAPTGTDWENTKVSGKPLDKPDPANGIKPSDPGAIWWLETIVRAKSSNFPGGCGVTRKYTYTTICPAGSTVQGYQPVPGGVLTANGCGGYNFPIEFVQVDGSVVPNSGAYTLSTDQSASGQIFFGSTYTQKDEIVYE